MEGSERIRDAVLEGYRGEGTLNRAWLRERLAQVQWKAKHCPDEDIATEEEDELLDMLHADCERRDRFLRELNAPDSEGDCMNVHKYYWGAQMATFLSIGLSWKKRNESFKSMQDGTAGS